MFKFRKREVVVNTKTGSAIKGIFFSVGRVYVLKQANLIGDGQSVVMDGEVAILRSEVDFVQVL